VRQAISQLVELGIGELFFLQGLVQQVGGSDIFEALGIVRGGAVASYSIVLLSRSAGLQAKGTHQGSGTGHRAGRFGRIPFTMAFFIS
jgi:hypothetical protein